MDKLFFFLLLGSLLAWKKGYYGKLLDSDFGNWR
jgi:hypothetical protein